MKILNGYSQDKIFANVTIVTYIVPFQVSIACNPCSVLVFNACSVFGEHVSKLPGRGLQENNHPTLDHSES